MYVCEDKRVNTCSRRKNITSHEGRRNNHCDHRGGIRNGRNGKPGGKVEAEEVEDILQWSSLGTQQAQALDDTQAAVVVAGGGGDTLRRVVVVVVQTGTLVEDDDGADAHNLFREGVDSSKIKSQRVNQNWNKEKKTKTKTKTKGMGINSIQFNWMKKKKELTWWWIGFLGSLLVTHLLSFALTSV